MEILYKTQNTCETSLHPFLIERSFSNNGSMFMPILVICIFLYSSMNYVGEISPFKVGKVDIPKYELSEIWMFIFTLSSMNSWWYCRCLLIILCSQFSELGTAICPRINRNEEIVLKYSGFYPLHKDNLLEKTYRRFAREIQDRFNILLSSTWRCLQCKKGDNYWRWHIVFDINYFLLTKCILKELVLWQICPFFL